MKSITNNCFDVNALVSLRFMMNSFNDTIIMYFSAEKMTIPRSKLFKNSRGFQAQADVGINSPHQTNTQSVNVILQPSPSSQQSCRSSSPQPLTKDKELSVLLNKANVEEREVKLEDVETVEDKIDVKPLNDELEVLNTSSKELNHINERNIETAKETLNELQTIIKNKDNLIEALSLILDIYENNPLIVNKLIISREDELSRLLFLLTDAKSIEIIKDDPDIGCCKYSDKLSHISKILIHKNDNTYNFKYSFPNAVNLLDNRRISWKVCV